MLVIGIIGQPSSGKDTAANYLASKGFQHIHTSDLIREEMRREGIPTDRAHIHDFVKARRAERGLDYVAREAAEKVAGDCVISGFRNTAEVNVFKNKFGKNFILLAVEAPLELRYERARARNRTGDDISFEQFRAEEEAERRSATHEVDNVIAMADHAIANAGSEEELFKQIDEVLERVKNANSNIKTTI